MKIAVSNSGPLIHLARINRLDLLFSLFENVLIPKSVYIEAVEQARKEGHHDAHNIQQEIEKGRIEIRLASEEFLKQVYNENLHKGELEVVALALENKDKMVLLDDEETRIFALAFGLKIKGTLGIIIDNVHSATISRKKGIQLIKDLNIIMYLSSDVFNFAIESI